MLDCPDTRIDSIWLKMLLIFALLNIAWVFIYI